MASRPQCVLVDLQRRDALLPRDELKSHDLRKSSVNTTPITAQFQLDFDMQLTSFYQDLIKGWIAAGAMR